MYTQLKTVSELATILGGLSKITIYRKVAAGIIPHKRINRMIRFSDDQIRSYLASIDVSREEATGEK